MRRRLHLTDAPWEADYFPPPPIPFPGPNDALDWSLSTGLSGTAVAEDVLHTLDQLSVTLDDIRREVDSLNLTDGPPSAA
jgi:hypothetical protein